MITLEEIIQLTPTQYTWCTNFASKALGYELDYSQIHNDFVQDIWRVAIAAMRIQENCDAQAEINTKHCGLCEKELQDY